uniref:Golgin subfamily A conserved domain-containing protein n=1 Tax=Pan troglodytes TaxID=9598 RepID=H2RES8_PANTR
MLPVDGEERKSEGSDTEGDRTSPCGPTSSATLKDLEVGGSGRRCSDPAGQPSNLLPQRGLGAPLPAETAHTQPSPNDRSLYLSPKSSSASSSLHAPQSPCQEQAAVLDSRSIKISRLNDTIKSLKQQKKQVEHQLEEEKKANNEKQKAERELEGQIQRLNREKKKLNTDLYHMKHSLRYFEEESKDLAGRLQRSPDRNFSLFTIQFSSCSKALLKRQLEQSIREQILLKGHVTQLKESLKEVQLERDQYAEQIKGERAQWQQRMRKMSQEVCTLKEEKKHDTHRVEELERSLSRLKNQMALPPDAPAVSLSGAEDLRRSWRVVAGELQAQVENNQCISLLNLREQEERLHGERRGLGNRKELQQLAEATERLEGKNENKSQQVKELQEKPQVTETSLGREEPEAAVQLRTGASLPSACRSHGKLEGKVHRLLTEPGDSAKDAAPRGGHHQAGPGRGGEEGDAAGAAGDGVAACGNYSEGHGKFLAAARNPAAEPSPGAPAPQELGAANERGDLCEVSLTNSVEPAQGEAREGSSQDKPTAQPIVQLLGEMQNHQEHPGLGSNCCVPCFCWAWLPRRRR